MPSQSLIFFLFFFNLIVFYLLGKYDQQKLRSSLVESELLKVKNILLTILEGVAAIWEILGWINHFVLLLLGELFG